MATTIYVKKLHMNYKKNKKRFAIKHKCYIIIELTFLKELILIKHVHRKNVIFVTMRIFQTKDSCFNHMYAIDVKI